MQRFLVEARATGQLEHPNIPPIYELGKDQDGKPYFALKLVRGQSMRQVLERLKAGEQDVHDKYRFQHRMQIFQKVCQAVAYAHERGVLHRDIKPCNIMIGELGEVFLLDWGLASSTGEAPGCEEADFVGTPTYAAPEQLASGAVTAKSDVYGLGATLYEWLTLKPPFEGKDLSELLTAVLTKEPQNPFFITSSVQDRVPTELCRVAVKALHKDPSKRLSLDQLLDEVEDVLEGDVCAVCPTTTFRSGMYRLNRVLDNYPILIVLVFLWVLYPLYALVRWAVQ